MASVLNTKLSTILTSIQATAVTANIGFTAPATYLSIQIQPPLQATTSPVLAIIPGNQTAMESFTKGAGRYNTAIQGEVTLVVYFKQALDQIYQQTEILTLSVANLLDTTHSLYDTFQLAMVEDGSGNGLLLEPMRLVTSKEPIRYKKSREWAYSMSTFEVRYFLDLSTAVPLPVVTS